MEQVKKKNVFVRIMDNETEFDFVKPGRYFLYLSALLVVATIALWAIKGFNFGLDFTGGTVIEMKYKGPVDLDDVEKALNSIGIHGAQMKHFGSAADVSLSLPPRDGEAAELSSRVLGALQVQDPAVEMTKVEYVGPQVGGDLIEGGVQASLLAMLGIVIYIMLRFEWKLSVCSLIATLHDLFFVLMIFMLFSIEFDLTTLAAVLSVIGYSVNDTVVVLDRIRENFLSSRRGSTKEIVNLSINQTMSRTIMTSLTTLVVVMVLYFFGGDAIHNFSLAMIIGVIVGTYSSIFIAAAGAVQLKLTREDLVKKPPEIDAMP